MKLSIRKTAVGKTANIMDVEIPKEMRIRHTSGIEWLDEAFAGGFIASSVQMLTGDPGAGKTTLVLQMADALTGSGHTVLYNTFEEDLVQIRMKAEQLGLKNGFVPAQHRLATALLEHADELKRNEPSKQVFIIQDSLPTLDDGFYKDGTTNSRTPMRACMMLTEWAKATRGIVLFINHVNKDGSFVGKNTVKHAIDAHARIRVDPKTGYRQFKVEKNRFGANYATFVVNMTNDGIKLIKKIVLDANIALSGERAPEPIETTPDNDEDVTQDLETQTFMSRARSLDEPRRGRGRGRRGVRL